MQVATFVMSSAAKIGSGLVVVKSISSQDHAQTRGRSWHPWASGAAALVLFLCPTAGAATPTAPLLVTIWRTPEGLPQNTVQALVQTSDLYLWAGTRAGLARFDGVRFTHFGLKDGLKGLDVVKLLEDPAGGLWIGTFGGGLSYLSNGKISTLTTEDGLLHNNATALASAGPGAVWVGGSGGLQRYGRDGFTTVGLAEGLPAAEIAALATSANGLWIATGQGLFFYENGHCQRIEGPPGLPKVVAHTLMVDSQDALWVSIGNGRVLRRLKGEWFEYNESHGLPYNFIYCFAEGAPGEIWAGSHESGLFVLREGKFAPAVTTGVRLGRSIRTIFAGNDGLVWIGTQANGLSRLRPRSVTPYPIGTDERRGMVHSVVEQPAGVFSVATFGGGLWRGPLEALAPVTGVLALEQSPYLLSALRKQDGSLLFAGANLLLQQDSKLAESQQFAGPRVITALVEASDGAVWLGARDGEIHRLRNGAVEPVEAGKFPGVIAGLATEPDGSLWIATRGGGLFRWADGNRRRWTTADGLPTDTLRALHRDAAGTLWIATAGGGLAWMEEGRLHAVHTGQGLWDDFLSQILEDDLGDLWLGGNRGISRVSKDELRAVAAGTAASVHPLVLNQSDGMLEAECTGGYAPAGLRSASGMLYFSCMQSVVAVDPKVFRATGPPPPVRIEAISQDGRIVQNEGLPLVLPPGPREVELRYTAFNFAKPDAIRFRYQLDGYTPGWVDAGMARTANFALLPPGRYLFKVSAANADGYWSEAPAELVFTVLHHFWETTWFHVGIVLTLVATGGGATAWGARARIRQAQAREQLARAEAEAQQRRSEVAHLTRVGALGELSAALAHELNQPLAAILSNAQAALRFLAHEVHDPAEIREILGDIVADDRRASEVIRRLRVLLKKGDFLPEDLDANEVLREVLQLMQHELATRGITVQTRLFPTPLPVRGDRVQLQQVVLNLLLNAADAMTQTPAGGRVLTVESSRTARGAIEIAVADTGCGIPAAAAEKIFAPYYTTKPEGLGLGLPLSRSILLAHGGRLWVEESPGPGATFRFTLPESPVVAA